jgi:hypothetical protein
MYVSVFVATEELLARPKTDVKSMFTVLQGGKGKEEDVRKDESK